MDTIRLEPINANPATITNDSTDQALLTKYLQFAGSKKKQWGASHSKGNNANIPPFWEPNVNVGTSNLTWGQLRDLIHRFSENVLVSPGIMQTLVTTADVNRQWLQTIYGNAVIHNPQSSGPPALAITHHGVVLVADAPPTSLNDLFSKWFGVSVNAQGGPATTASQVDPTLTKMKRALHNIIAGAVHIKCFHNYLTGAKNLVSDFDLPTVASAYNDGAAPAPVAVPKADPLEDAAEKWKRLFGVIFYDDQYPRHGTRYYNAAVSLFNALPAGSIHPSVRLWRR